MQRLKHRCMFDEILVYYVKLAKFFKNGKKNFEKFDRDGQNGSCSCILLLKYAVIVNV